MIIRDLKKDRYDYLCGRLNQNAALEPLCASYTVTMQVGKYDYAMKIQPERHCRMAILQALQIDRRDNSPNFGLITDGKLLSAFLDLLLWQGIR